MNGYLSNRMSLRFSSCPRDNEKKVKQNSTEWDLAKSCEESGGNFAKVVTTSDSKLKKVQVLLGSLNVS